jgi:hypothetical protein
MPGLVKEDLIDLDFVDAEELSSDGTLSYSSGVTVVSTTSSTKRVVVSGVNLLYDVDERAQSGDIVVLAGTSGGSGDGTFTIDTVVDATTFDVIESIGDSTGGTADFKHGPGAKSVGFDSSGLISVTSDNVQEAIEELDANKITASQHKSLRQLIHFVETNSPGDGFGSGPYYCEILPSSDPFPTSETWYETSSKLKKICRFECTYNANKTHATQKWIVYKSDGTSAAADATDTITYSGIFETNRSRSVSVY